MTPHPLRSDLPPRAVRGRAPRRGAWFGAVAGAVLAAIAAAAVPARGADIELTAPDGRRVLLNDDGTWRYAPEAAASAASGAASAPLPQAELQLLSQTERARGCTFLLRLENKLPYEILQIVPYFAAKRADGVAFDTLSVGFLSMRPGESQQRTLDFSGITCEQIASVQVSGGDRCSMGDLEKFSDAKGACLARIRVLPSTVTRFEK